MNYPRYPEYKDSGVEWLGEVPSHWAIHSLRHCFESVFNGLTATQIDESFDCVPVTRIETISCGVIDEDRLGYIQKNDAREDRRLQIGDILFSNINSLNMIGNCAIYCGGKEIYAGMNLLVLRPQDSVNSQWLYWLMKSKLIRNVVESLAKPAINQASISQSSLNSITVNTPPLDEQQLIASFLDRETSKIDALIAEQQRLIELLKEKRQAVISHAVTKGLDPNAKMKDSGVEWLGMVPEGWEVKKLKHIKATTPNSFVDGPFGSNLKSEHFVDGGDVYVIESNFATQNKLNPEELKTITQEHFETVKRSETINGDIIIAKIGAQFGKSSILPALDKPAVVSGNSMKLTVNKDICHTLWAYWQLFNLKVSGEIDLIPNGCAQPALSLGEMNQLNFLLPSLKEQTEIISYLDVKINEYDHFLNEVQHAIDLLQERRTAVISAAVMGKIDVR